MDNQIKKTIFSGIQPSGTLTIGNYIGSIKNWLTLSDEYNCIYCVVDMHAMTVRQVPADLRRRTYEIFAIYLACGLDPEKNILFVQSHVPAHAQLSWILNCYTMFGELSRMTQFKDKSAKYPQNVNAGLFTYPVLMAADILLYQADLVPVGDDQKQHVEITRDIAERFNQAYSDTFVIPQDYMPKLGARIKSLIDPTRKMDKSDPNPNAFISLIDSRDTVIKKFKSAVTDSDTVIKFADGKDGINNLMTIYSCFTGKTFDEIESEFSGRGYGDFKLAVGEVVADGIAPIQSKFREYMNDKAYLEEIIKKGAESAAKIAYKTLSKVYKKVGFIQPK